MTTYCIFQQYDTLCIFCKYIEPRSHLSIQLYLYVWLLAIECVDSITKPLNVHIQ